MKHPHGFCLFWLYDVFLWVDVVYGNGGYPVNICMKKNKHNTLNYYVTDRDNWETVERRLHDLLQVLILQSIFHGVCWKNIESKAIKGLVDHITWLVSNIDTYYIKY